MENMITVKPKMLKGEILLPKAKGLSDGDFGVGAYFLVAGAIGNEIICKGISAKSKQKEAKILDIIKMAGAKVIEGENGISAKMTGSMKGIDVDIKGVENILPAVALLCAFLKGESRIFGVKNIRPDLTRGIASEFNHLGIYTEITSTGLYIKGEQTIRSDGAYCWNNSDLAFTLTLMASRAEGEVRILGVDSEDKKLRTYMKLYDKLNDGLKGDE